MRIMPQKERLRLSLRQHFLLRQNGVLPRWKKHPFLRWDQRDWGRLPALYLIARER